MLEEEIQDVTEESSTQEDVESESSTDELSEATEEQAVQEEEKPTFADHPAWQRQLEERRTADERASTAEANAAYWRGKAEAGGSSPEAVDPDANLDPQTKVFYQDLDKRTQKAIDKARKEERAAAQVNFDALALQNAKIQERLFREDQKDVSPGSKEENEIAGLIRQGVDPNKAAWAVMGPKRVESAKSNKVVKQQNKTKLKAQANMETSGVQEGSGLPAGETVDFRSDLDRRMKESGL